MKRSVKGSAVSFTDDIGKLIAQLTEEKKEDKVWQARLSGSVTNECANDIADELYAIISVNNGIILDMSDTQYVSSTFAELLVQLQVRMEKTEFESMPIQNMPVEIYRSLKEGGCITSLDYELKEE